MSMCIRRINPLTSCVLLINQCNGRIPLNQAASVRLVLRHFCDEIKIQSCPKKMFYYLVNV